MKEPESELKEISAIRIPNIKDASDPLPKLAPQLDHSAINGESTPVPLDYLIDDHKLLNRLQSIGIFNTSDLWIPIIFDQVFGNYNKIELIRCFLRAIESRISPYKASYCKLDYSVRLETGNSPLSAFGTAPFSIDHVIIQLEIIIRDVKINMSVMYQPEIMEMDTTDIEYKDLVDQVKAGVIRLDYETSPKILEWQKIIKAEKYPLIANLLEVLDTKAKGYSDPLKSREVFTKRNGLISGKIETLEEIAVDKDLTRERIRQIEDKANKFLWVRIAKDPYLLSCRKTLKDQISVDLLFDNKILEGEELTAFLSTYIDFEDYHPAQAAALLSKYAKLFVQRSRDGKKEWFVTLTKPEYDTYCNIFLLVVGIELNQPESGMAFNRDLFNDIRLIFKYHNENDIRNIRATAKSIIGSSKVMRFEHFITSLVKNCKFDERIFENYPQGQFESEYIAGDCNTSICKVAGVSILPCAEYENIVFGRWVIYDLTKTTEKIVRAILYAGVDQVEGSFGSDHFNELRKGISLSDIVKYLQSRFGMSITEHAVEADCNRFPRVFIRTGFNKWGLIGAGSALSVDNEENNVTDMKIIDGITDLLLNSQRDMTISELISGVREVVPNALEATIKIYLNRTHKERFERTHHGTYRLSQRYLIHLEDSREQESTIGLLIQIMENAQGPLNVPEIIRRCERKRFVSHAAIRTYLGQNYRGRFTRLENGYYILSSDW